MTAFVFEIFFDSSRVALEHVEEVGVAADVQLHRLVEVDAALAEEAREHAVRDRGADLRLDVVADDRQALLLEAAAASTASRAMKTGMQLTIAQPASRHCSAYHFAAISEPTGR